MTKFYAIVTSLGAARIANAAALGTKITLTHMAVGDGNGSLPTPNASQTALVNEVRRGALNSLTVDDVNTSQIIAEQVIPENEGGFWIREIGLFDTDGVLIAVANCAETYKPQLQEGSGRTQRLRMIIVVNSTEAVTVKIDPSVVLATRQYVDERVIEVRQYAESLMNEHMADADPHPQYAPKKSPVLTGIPKAPTAAAGDNSQQLANTAFVTAALAALAGSAPAALDTLNELAAAMGDDPNFSTTVLNALAGKMDIAKNGADIGSVPEFLKNLGLSEARFVISRGRNVNGIFEIWSDGAIEMTGFGPAPAAGLATATYPIQLPGDAVPIIMITDMISTDPGNTPTLHQSVLITSSRTSRGFSVRQRSTNGIAPANGFVWRATYAPV